MTMVIIVIRRSGMRRFIRIRTNDYIVILRVMVVVVRASSVLTATSTTTTSDAIGATADVMMAGSRADTATSDAM